MVQVSKIYKIFDYIGLVNGICACVSVCAMPLAFVIQNQLNWIYWNGLLSIFYLLTGSTEYEDRFIFYLFAWHEHPY